MCGALWGLSKYIVFSAAKTSQSIGKENSFVQFAICDQNYFPLVL